MIVFSHVTKQYSGAAEPALKDLSFRIRPGEICAITGKSGSGKTTLLKLIAREEELTGGQILVEGRDIAQVSGKRLPFYRRELGIVFQDTCLIEDETVYNNLRIAMLAAGDREKNADTRITSVLSMMGIPELHRKYPGSLSGGERQKVCLARAVINHPKILLADEPTGNLDPGATEEVFRLLQLIQQRGTTVLAATHDIKWVRKMSLREIRLDWEETIDV